MTCITRAAMDLRSANVILTQEPAQGPRGCEGSREAARPQVLLSTLPPFPLKKCHIYPSHTLTTSSDSFCRNESTALNMFEDNCHSAVHFLNLRLRDCGSSGWEGSGRGWSAVRVTDSMSLAPAIWAPVHRAVGSAVWETCTHTSIVLFLAFWADLRGKGGESGVMGDLRKPSF